jgi:hypothetical protein
MDESLFISAYIEAIKFTEKIHTDAHPSTADRIEKSCCEFMRRAEELCPEVDWNDPEMVTHAAHDFWLTRNGHGAGFWDGDWPDEVGRKLTALSKEFGEQWHYVGDDGLIYLEGGQ